MKIINHNIIMEEGKTVDGRDVSEDGKKLDQSTYKKVPNTLVLRDNTGYADVLVSAALKLNIPRKFTFFGDIDASILFDGTQDVFIEVRVRDDSHTHNEDYYTKKEINIKLETLSIQGHEHALIRSGEGIKFFNYNGTVDQSVEASWAGISGDWGTETKHVSRSDHKHHILYYTKDEALDNFIVKLAIENDNISVIDGKGNVHNKIQVPWALRLGPALGVKGLSLNSTDLNNEVNKVVRTDNDGNTKFSLIKTLTEELSNNIAYVYVDFGDSYIKKCSINHVFRQNAVSGNNVLQHGHSRLWATSHINSNYVYNEWDGKYWRLKSNNNAGISVSHSDLASTALYADLAEYYIVKNANKIKEGTVLSIPIKDKWELEECLDECSSSVVGVISSNPGFILNAKDKDTKNSLPVALKGKNPVRIVGKITKGDPIVSNGKGTARKIKHNTELFFSFGIALESNEEESEKLINCFIK